MKQLKDTLASAAAAATADTRNAEGAPAWTMRDGDRLVQLAMTGTLGPAFYATAQEVTAEAAALLERAEAAPLADAIVRGRNEGFIRTFPLLGLAYLSKKDSALFRETFPKVVLTGGDLGDFIDLAHRLRGFGRAVKSAIRDWLEAKTTPYYAQKYRKQLADAARIVRFRGKDPIWAWILSARAGAKGVTPERVAAAEDAHPALAARRDFVRAVETGDETRAVRLLLGESVDIDSLGNWSGRFTRAIWHAAGQRMPAMRFLKSIGKLLREGALDEDMVREKISVARLKAAKVFPFRLYAAWTALEDEEAISLQDPMPPNRPFAEALAPLPPLPDGTEAVHPAPPRTATPASVRAHLAETLDGYARAWDWAVFNRGSWVVAPDVSGSMWSRIGGSDRLRFLEVAGMFAAFFAAGLERVTVLPFDTAVRPYAPGPHAGVFEHIRALGAMPGGGTCLEAPLEEMLRRDIDADNSLFITDTEEWGKGWLGLWQTYRRKHPRARAFLLRLDSYRTQPFPPDQAESLGIRQIFGWSDSVVDYIRLELEREA
jgi:60 kDa SS-A/Ro ribonucleoprotein